MKTLFEIEAPEDVWERVCDIRKHCTGLYNWSVQLIWTLFPQPMCDNPEGTEYLPGMLGFHLPDGKVVHYGTFGYWLYRRNMAANSNP